MGKQMIVTDADFSENGIFGLEVEEKFDWADLQNPFSLAGTYVFANLKDFDGRPMSPASAVGVQARFSNAGSFVVVLVDMDNGTSSDVAEFSVTEVGSVVNYYFDSPVTIQSGKALGLKVNGMLFDDGVFENSEVFQIKPNADYNVLTGVIMPWKTITNFNW